MDPLRSCRFSLKQLVNQRDLWFSRIRQNGLSLVRGMLQASACKPDQIFVINRHPETIQAEAKQYNLKLARSPEDLVEQADVIVLGTKPADSPVS